MQTAQQLFSQTISVTQHCAKRPVASEQIFGQGYKITVTVPCISDAAFVSWIETACSIFHYLQRVLGGT